MTEEQVSQQETQSETETNPSWFDAVQAAAMQAKATFPDQIDYYDPEQDEIV